MKYAWANIQNGVLNKLVNSVLNKLVGVINFVTNKTNIEFIFFHTPKHKFERKFNFFQTLKKENLCLLYL